MPSITDTPAQTQSHKLPDYRLIKARYLENWKDEVQRLTVAGFVNSGVFPMSTILSRLAVGPDIWQVEEIRNELYQDIVSLVPDDFTKHFPRSEEVEAQLLPFYLYFSAKENEAGGDGTLAELFWEKMQLVNVVQTALLPDDLSKIEGQVIAAKQIYRSDWGAEVSRLTNARFIDSAMKAKCLAKSQAIYAVFGRLLELRELYRKTHYLFIHGQGQKIAACNDFMKATVKALNPERNLKHYQVLRYPTKTTKNATAATFLRDHRSIDDMTLDGELLSVDAYFWSHSPRSSAQYFFSKNSSATTTNTLIAKAIRPALDDIGLDALDARAIEQRLLSICAKAKQSTTLGNLYVICVPKQNIEDPVRSIGYPAHPRGKPCRCYSEGLQTAALRALQEGSVRHRCSTNGGVPQYRLLGHL